LESPRCLLDMPTYLPFQMKASRGEGALREGRNNLCSVKQFHIAAAESIYGLRVEAEAFMKVRRHTKTPRWTDFF
jgi:hypothetical protein